MKKIPVSKQIEKSMKIFGFKVINIKGGGFYDKLKCKSCGKAI